MTSSPTYGGARPITGRTVLIGLVAFFGIIALVNGVFMYLAFSSWPGLSQKDAYEDGLHYNRVIDEGQRQAKLGWRSEAGFDAAGRLRVRIVATSGEPVSGLSVSATVMRRLGAETRDAVDLVAGRDGTYSAAVAAPDPGAWTVTVVATGAAGVRYRMAHNVWISQ